MTAHGVVPGDRASHLTSLPYHLAIAACDPSAEYDIGQTPASLSKDVQAFMAKVTVAADEALLAHYPTTWPARITARTADKAHERLVLAVPGEPTRPLSGADLEAKFRRFVGNAAGAPAADSLLAASAGALGGPGAAAHLVGQIEGLYPKPKAFA
jgi:2-methylcitrate dehydratase PrpD